MPINCEQQCNTMTKIKTTQKLDKLDLLNLTEMENRYIKTQLDFPDLDLQLLDQKPFVLVSFGSVAEVSFFKSFIQIYEKSNFGNSYSNIL